MVNLNIVVLYEAVKTIFNNSLINCYNSQHYKFKQLQLMVHSASLTAKYNIQSILLMNAHLIRSLISAVERPGVEDRNRQKHTAESPITDLQELHLPLLRPCTDKSGLSS